MLIETLRREGFELVIGRPRVLFRDGSSGGDEPYVIVLVDVDDLFSGTVIDKMAHARKREMTDMRPSGGGKIRLTFSAPSRRPDRLSRRVPLRHPRHRHHEPPVRALWTLQGPDRRPARTESLSRRRRAPPAYALNALEERGILLVSPGETLYEGMVIGENAKTQDIEVNPLSPSS